MDDLIAAVIGVNDDFPNICAVDVGPGQAAMGGVERVCDVLVEPPDIVVHLGHEVQAVVGFVPADGRAAHVKIRGVGCAALAVEFRVLGIVVEVLGGHFGPVGRIAVHLRDVVVGKLEDLEGGVFGVVGEGGQGEQQNADSRNPIHDRLLLGWTAK